MGSATGTLQQTHDGSLVVSAGPSDDPLPSLHVHVLGLAADVDLIGLNLAVHLVDGAVLHGEADTVQHEPSGLLGDSEIAGQLVTRNAVLAVSEHPHRGEPLAELDRGALDDRSNLHAEDLPAVAALPRFARREPVVLRNRSTLGASLFALGPTKLRDVLDRLVFVREVTDRLEQCLDRLILLAGHRLTRCAIIRSWTLGMDPKLDLPHAVVRLDYKGRVPTPPNVLQPSLPLVLEPLSGLLLQLFLRRCSDLVPSYHATHKSLSTRYLVPLTTSKIV